MLRERYQRSQLPEPLRYDYEKQLSKVKRWKKGLVESAKSETNLEHVSSMFELLDEVKARYPTLVNGLDLTAVEDMIYIHDAGEIISKDLVRSRPDYLEVKKRWKRKERLGFHILLSKYVKDEGLKEEAREAYNRYTVCDPNDPETLFTHLLDKIQAIRFGLEHVYNSRIFPINLSRKQAAMSIDLILEFAIPLLAITSGEARTQLSAFIETEIDGYTKSGFADIAEDAKSKLFSGNKPTTS